MALAFTQQPDYLTVKGQRFIYTASSTNTSEPGFRYKFTLTLYLGLSTTVESFYIPPNPSSRGILDARSWLDKQMFVDRVQPSDTDVSIHGGYHQLKDNNYYNMRLIECDVEEAWVVDGVLTDSPSGSSTPPAGKSSFVFSGAFQANQAYQPSLDSYIYPNNDVTILTKWHYNHWKQAPNYGLEDAIAIPVFEDSWGCMAYLVDDTWDTLTYKIFDEDGNQLGVQIDLDMSGGFPASAGLGLRYFALYPKSVSSSIYFSFPTVYPPDSTTDWCYYTFQFTKSSSDVARTIVCYKVCDDRYDNVHIGWANSMGGWDYYDFKGKSTPTFTTSKKRYNRVLGDFGSSTYNHFSWDRGVTDFGSNTERYIEVTATNMRADDYAYLVDLIRSDDIYIIPNGGEEAEPEGVVLMNTEYAQEQMKRPELKELTLRFRYSNDLW